MDRSTLTSERAAQSVSRLARTSADRGPGPWPIKRNTLSRREVEHLLGRRLIASLATRDREGRVHVVPMWYLPMPDELLFPTSSRTRKVNNIRKFPVATAMIHDSRGGLNNRGVMITGRVEVLGGEKAQDLNRQIHRRYMTALGLRQPEVIELLRDDDVTLRLVVGDIVSWKFKAGESQSPPWSKPLA